jgi:hypothetical protein
VRGEGTTFTWATYLVIKIKTTKFKSYILMIKYKTTMRRGRYPRPLLKNEYPEIWSTIDPRLNPNINIHTLTSHCGTKVKFKCPKGSCGHHISEVAVSSRVSRVYDCGYCEGIKVCVCTSIVTTHPHLLEIWDYERNEEINPATLSYGSGKLINWKCPNACCEKHRYKMTIDHKNNGQECPYCSHHKMCPCQSFLVTHPELIEELNEEANEGMDLNKLRAGSREELGWICLKCGNDWFASPHSRINRHSTCPNCNESSLEKRVREILERLQEEYEYEFGRQRTFNTCRNKNKLPFDFNILKFILESIIEVDGDQHFRKKDSGPFAGKWEFIHMTDVIKTLFCCGNKKHLLRISYSEIGNAEKHIREFFEAIIIAEREGDFYPVFHLRGKEYKDFIKIGTDEVNGQRLPYFY